MEENTMNEQKLNVPTLRFPEFSGEWGKLVFGDIYTFRPTNSYSRDNLNYEKGSVKNIHYGDIHVKYKSLFNIKNEETPFINDEVNFRKISADNYCKEQDLIIVDASEDYADIGKSIEIIDLDNQRVLAGLHTILARPEKLDMSLGFGGYLMQIESVRLQIKRISQGTKVLSLSSKRLAEIDIAISSLPEQTKIATFLSVVDERMALLNKKHKTLEKYKKGIIQKLFSQELRFKDENGTDFPDWQRTKAKELFVSITNKKHTDNMPILAITQEGGAVARDAINYNVQVSKASIASYKVIEKGDFIISLRSFQGGIEYSNVNGICSPAYTILKPKIDIYDQYFKYYFKRDDFIQELSNTVEGIRDGKNISYSNFGALYLVYPNLPEQEKIANCLSSIDDKITAITTQIKNLEQYKKALLQQMFV